MLTVSSYSYLFGSVREIKLAVRQLLGARKYGVSCHIVSCRIVLCFHHTRESGWHSGEAVADPDGWLGRMVSEEMGTPHHVACK